jgi:squalene-associated FAD-dependent desaturase
LTAPEVVVIGGGFAGLSAATALAEDGAHVLVVEARRQLGGRATAYRDPLTGERIDNGQHVLAGCYDETIGFLRRIGAIHALKRPSVLEVSMIDEAGTRHELRLPPLPPPLHLLAGVLAWRQLAWRERLAILRIGPALQNWPREQKDAARETVKRWLLRHGQPPRLCHLFWEPLALATLNQSIEVAAAAPFLTVIHRMLGGGAEAATLLLPVTLLDELYAAPSVTFLRERGSACMTGRPAHVLTTGDRIRGVRVGAEEFEAPVVISAVPWFSLGELFEPPPACLSQTLADAAALASSPIVTVNIWLDRTVMHEDFVGLPGRVFQWAFDKGRIVGAGLSHLSVVSSGAEAVVALDNRALSRMALDELGSALPGFRQAQVRRVSVVRERRATFSLSPTMPPRPASTTALQGLLLAGDWIDTGLPATIESAVVSGHRAARLAQRLRH